jgi:hypothetical protein
VNLFNKGLRALYEQLLQLSEKEEQAITADNLGELEACMRRKEDILKNLRETENGKGEHEASENIDVAQLLVRVVESHERVREQIKAMVGECQQAILEIRTGSRAHRAYDRARRNGRERSARLL